MYIYIYIYIYLQVLSERFLDKVMDGGGNEYLDPVNQVAALWSGARA